jgi:hypothetical protein
VVDVLSQDLENFHEDYILRDSNMRGDQRTSKSFILVLSVQMRVRLLNILDVN